MKCFWFFENVTMNSALTRIYSSAENMSSFHFTTCIPYCLWKGESKIGGWPCILNSNKRIVEQKPPLYAPSPSFKYNFCIIRRKWLRGNIKAIQLSQLIDFLWFEVFPFQSSQ